MVHLPAHTANAGGAGRGAAAEQAGAAPLHFCGRLSLLVLRAPVPPPGIASRHDACLALPCPRTPNALWGATRRCVRARRHTRGAAVGHGGAEKRVLRTVVHDGAQAAVHLARAARAVVQFVRNFAFVGRCGCRAIQETTGDRRTERRNGLRNAYRTPDRIGYRRGRRQRLCGSGRRGVARCRTLRSAAHAHCHHVPARRHVSPAAASELFLYGPRVFKPVHRRHALCYSGELKLVSGLRGLDSF
mmetsp:Transcript_62818/g.139873  ORF Transcript_62818/g.139873 Transcript_62818/m.139873 type:complete len:245 (+) Transcript_62818:105-839(+)